MLTVGQTFTVTGTLENTGTAALEGVDSLRLALPSGDQYTTTTALVQAVIPGNSVAWTVKAPNSPTNSLQAIIVSIEDQNSTDENSGLAPPTIPLPVNIQVLTQSTGLNLTLLTERSPRTIVRGATDTTAIGQTYVEPVSAELHSDSGGVRTSLVELPDGSGAFDFRTPILFQNQEVGSIRLGLSRAKVEDVERTTLILLLALAIVTIAAVAIVSFVLARILARPINIAREGLEEVTRGRNLRGAGFGRVALGQRRRAYLAR